MESPVSRRFRLRPYVLPLAVLLTILSLVAIFSAVLGYLPTRFLPESDTAIRLIPHLNVLVSLAAIGTISYGLFAIRRRRIGPHRRAMLASTALFAVFLVMYLYRVSLEGPTPFEGPELVRQYVFLPLLAVHVLLAIVCLPFVFLSLLLAGTHPVGELRNTAHPRVGRIAALLWLISFTLGICVYGLLHVLY